MYKKVVIIGAGGHAKVIADIVVRSQDILLGFLDDNLEKEKKVILLYYYEELTLKEISAVLEVSESRISQLHTKAIQKLRLKLGNQIEIFF